VRTLALTIRDQKPTSGRQGETDAEKAGRIQDGNISLPAWVNSGNVADCEELGSLAETAQVHPGQLTRALLTAAQTQAGGGGGSVQLVRQRVVGIDLSSSTVGGGQQSALTAVRLADGSVCRTDVVVLAMGPWTGRGLADLLGVHGRRGGGLVIDGSRAHSILVRPPPADAAEVDSTALFLTVRDEEGHHQRKCLDPEVYPRPDGTVYVCLGGDDPAPLPDHPADVQWDEAACRRLSAIAARVSERLAASPEQESACYLPNPGDGRGPLLGGVPGVRGAYVAAGHSCWGILQVLVPIAVVLVGTIDYFVFTLDVLCRCIFRVAPDTGLAGYPANFFAA
jgi:glycine/D-amino acid oxidase-like deaminating enzyme